MEEVSSGVRRIDPHDIPHFCYQEGSVHDADQNEEFDEIEGLFGGYLLHRVSTLLFQCKCYVVDEGFAL
jgi:hypothetical protein